jgi:hypothetical protein
LKNTQVFLNFHLTDDFKIIDIDFSQQTGCENDLCAEADPRYLDVPISS